MKQKPYSFTMAQGIIYKREKPENRWKNVRNLIPKELAKRFLESVKKEINAAMP